MSASTQPTDTCSFCAIVHRQTTPPGGLIIENEDWLVALQAHPVRQPCLPQIVLKRHCGQIHDLTDQEAQSLGSLIKEVNRLTEIVVEPARIYFHLRAGSSGHLHVHVFPRLVTMPTGNIPNRWINDFYLLFQRIGLVRGYSDAAVADCAHQMQMTYRQPHNQRQQPQTNVKLLLVPDCYSCDLISARIQTPGGTVFDDEFWAVHLRPRPTGGVCRPILVLKRHAEEIGDLTDDELAQFGPMLKATCQVLADVIAPATVAIGLYAEGVRHIHLHIIPYEATEPSSIGTTLWHRLRAAAGPQKAYDDELVASVGAKLRTTYQRLYTT